MSYLLDTNICSWYLKGHARVHNRFMQYAGRLSLSVITVAELRVWQLRSQVGAAKSQLMSEMYNDVTVLDVTSAVALKFAELRSALLDVGRPVPLFDLLIAATALVPDLVLVTHNVKDFAGIPDLTVIDWLEP